MVSGAQEEATTTCKPLSAVPSSASRDCLRLRKTVVCETYTGLRRDLPKRFLARVNWRVRLRGDHESTWSHKLTLEKKSQCNDSLDH